MIIRLKRQDRASSMAFQASSSSFGRRWPYDVFLSFRSEDTHLSFTARLCKALSQNGICTYMDDKRREEGEISPEILKAIKDSRTSIVVLSENYASSTWCLSELIEILRCRESNQHIVLPVFYQVDPSDVRHQKKNFGEALAQHQDSFMEETMQSWKASLNKVANLSGWHLEKGGRNEFKFVDEIVEAVSRIVNRTYLSVAKYPVGIESRIQDINGLLHIGMTDIRMIGIFGAGGIGKTTIAKAIYNSFAYQFKDSCFLANVRETSMKECGLVQLQETLLSEILGNSSLKVGNVDRGINVIKERLCCKKVLLVLDDVDELVQVKALSGEPNWFGLGSRIIITTRDEHLLIKHNVDLTYKMNEMDHNEAFQLFSLHAFKSDKPHDDFVDFTKHALCYAGGLPLALTVLGSDLYGRDIHYWKSALKKYKRIPEKNILEKLQLSYDGLEESEKNIFLDIACFFKGQNAKYVTKILESCSFFPDIGITVLAEKSLITIDEDKLVMHDLLQDMGREIVRQESPKEPGKRSRLWFHEDVRYVLEENMVTNKIEGILIELPQRDLICLSSEVFMKMKMLRLFINHNACFSRRPSYLSNELRLLDWAECPLQSLPSNFLGKKLVVFKIDNSPFKELKQEFKNFQNMRIMAFTKCNSLTKMPDISGIPHLEEFTLSGCSSLVEVHDSLGFLDKLSYLSIRACSNLICLPRSLKLRSLEMLFLDGCSSLQNFPEIEIQMESLRDITLDDTAIKELPSSLAYLTGLRQLYLNGCKSLMHLPNSILQLQHLEILSLKHVKLPTKVIRRDERQSMPSNVLANTYEVSSSTEQCSLPPPTNSSILNDGCSSIGLPALTNLDLENCCLSKSDFLETLNCFSTLEHLNLSKSDIVSLPVCIKRFVGLRSLLLVDCTHLQEILELPPNIEDIDASGCVSLERFPEVSKKYQFNTSDIPALEWIDLSRCYKMLVNIGNQVTNPSWDEGHLKDYVGGIIFPGNRIPDWFSYRNETSKSKSCEIDINTGRLHLDEIKGIVFCVVMGTTAISPEDPIAYIYVNIIDEGAKTSIGGRVLNFMGSDHVWLQYSALQSSELKGNNLRVEFYSRSDSMLFKSCGVHLIHKNEENAKDHPGVLHEHVNDHLDIPDEKIENSVDVLMDGFQLSKRHLDDEDHNLESNWHPQQKRRSLTSL